MEHIDKMESPAPTSPTTDGTARDSLVSVPLSDSYRYSIASERTVDNDSLDASLDEDEEVGSYAHMEDDWPANLSVVHGLSPCEAGNGKPCLGD